jgi:hypothetical protein
VKRILGKLTYANVMATVAVFIALGGVGYAATRVPKNSVGTGQLRNKAITAAKIRDGAVTAAKLAPGSIGTVANAANAANAIDAGHANSADRASVADSAAVAESARVAANANALNGLPATSFQLAANSLSGSGSTAVPKQTILDIPNGPNVTTGSSGSNTFIVDLDNTTGSGGETWRISSANSETTLGPGGSGGVILTGDIGAITVTNEALTRSLTAECTFVSIQAQIACSGTLFKTG